MIQSTETEFFDGLSAGLQDRIKTYHYRIQSSPERNNCIKWLEWGVETDHAIRNGRDEKMAVLESFQLDFLELYFQPVKMFFSSKTESFTSCTPNSVALFVNQPSIIRRPDGRRKSIADQIFDEEFDNLSDYFSDEPGRFSQNALPAMCVLRDELIDDLNIIARKLTEPFERIQRILKLWSFEAMDTFAVTHNLNLLSPVGDLYEKIIGGVTRKELDSTDGLIEQVFRDDVKPELNRIQLGGLIHFRNRRDSILRISKAARVDRRFSIVQGLIECAKDGPFDRTEASAAIENQIYGKRLLLNQVADDTGSDIDQTNLTPNQIAELFRHLKQLNSTQGFLEFMNENFETIDTSWEETHDLWVQRHEQFGIPVRYPDLKSFQNSYYRHRESQKKSKDVGSQTQR